MHQELQDNLRRIADKDMRAMAVEKTDTSTIACHSNTVGDRKGPMQCDKMIAKTSSLNNMNPQTC